MVVLERRVQIPEEVLFTDLGSEAILLNLRTGKYYGLDEVGARMWSLLSQHNHLQAVYRVLLDEYDVSEEQLRQDVVSLVDRLAAHELLQVDAE